MTDQLRDEVNDWLDDCFGARTGYHFDATELSDDEAKQAIERYWDGGWADFVNCTGL